jgi:hypothetical protein
MEKAVSRLNEAIGSTSNAPNANEIGGEFPITDLTNGQDGSLEICMDGIGVTFNSEKVNPPFNLHHLTDLNQFIG